MWHMLEHVTYYQYMAWRVMTTWAQYVGLYHVIESSDVWHAHPHIHMLQT
jgi:hypothetical protein